MIRRENMPTLLRNGLTTSGRMPGWIDEVFDELFSGAEHRFFPGLNVSETDTQFEVSVELPGMRKEDIDISLDDNVLTVSGERKITRDEEEGRRFHRVESRFGSFSRSLPLPNIIDRENVEASYENGVLNITIPKLKEKAARKIEVS